MKYMWTVISVGGIQMTSFTCERRKTLFQKAGNSPCISSSFTPLYPWFNTCTINLFAGGLADMTYHIVHEQNHKIPIREIMKLTRLREGERCSSTWLALTQTRSSPLPQHELRLAMCTSSQVPQSQWTTPKRSPLLSSSRWPWPWWASLPDKRCHQGSSNPQYQIVYPPITLQSVHCETM